jgi:hypothetical protein
MGSLPIAVNFKDIEGLPTKENFKDIENLLSAFLSSTRKSALSLGLALWHLPPHVGFQVSGCDVR